MPFGTRSPLLGALWLLFVSVLVAVNAWLLAGCVVPYLTGGAEPEYLIVLPSAQRLFAWWLGAFIVVFLAQVVRVRVAGQGRAATAAEGLGLSANAYLAPTVLLVLPLLASALLMSPLRSSAGALVYLGLDLRWWLFALVAALLIAPRLHARSAPISSYGLEVALAALLLSTSMLASPPARFQSILIGDEPKYLRYLENWYRGRGMDISDLGPIAEVPPGTVPNLSGNLRRFGAAAAEVARDMTSSAGPSGATSQGGWFVEGKRGGVYQVHNAGISLLLLPGYVIDRTLDHTHNWHPQFPSTLYATGATVLILYVLWGIATFRLLTAHTGRSTTSWLVTAVAFLSLPTAAFAYQYYPEVAAGLLIAALLRYGLVSSESRAWPAALYGVAAGYLPWLHLRFLPVAIAAVALIVWTRRRDHAAAAAVVAGAALPVIALGAYYYHVTGSFTPWAMYALTTDGALFSATRAWRDLPSFWLDRTWGLLAHAPIYLLALPGLVISWRNDRRLTAGVVGAILLIAIPAAGHGYTGAFTTPLRLVAAVVPLLAVPLADAAIAYASRAWFVAAFALLGVVSVQNGLTYNVHLIKSEASLHAATVSGWMFPLLLPDFDTPNRLRQLPTWLWLIVTAALLCYPLVAARTASPSQKPRSRSGTVVAAYAVALFVITGALVGAAAGLRFSPAFTLNAGAARDRLIHAALTEHPSLQWSSTHGSVDVKAYFQNPDGTDAAVVATPDQAHPGEAVAVSIDIRRPGNRAGWGSASVDFGDRSPRVSLAIEGSARTRHVYAAAGDYQIRVTLDLWGLPARMLIAQVHVAAD